MARFASRKTVYGAASVTGFCLGVAYLVNGVLSSTNSTAAVGLLLAPVFGASGAALALALAYVAFSAADVLSRRESLLAPNSLLALALILLTAFVAVAWKQRQDALALARDPRTSGQDLVAVRGQWLVFRAQIDEALATNPHTPVPTLESMARGTSPRVIALVGTNPSAPPALLDEIVLGPLSYDRVWGAAGNPRLSRAAAERLVRVQPSDFPGGVEYELYQTYVLSRLARNAALGQDLFDRLAAWRSPDPALATQIIYAARASCEQVRRFTAMEPAPLANAAKSELKKRGCGSRRAP